MKGFAVVYHLAVVSYQYYVIEMSGMVIVVVVVDMMIVVADFGQMTDMVFVDYYCMKCYCKVVLLFVVSIDRFDVVVLVVIAMMVYYYRFVYYVDCLRNCVDIGMVDSVEYSDYGLMYSGECVMVQLCQGVLLSFLQVYRWIL